jgi:hypothetical protein
LFGGRREENAFLALPLSVGNFAITWFIDVCFVVFALGVGFFLGVAFALVFGFGFAFRNPLGCLVIFFALMVFSFNFN